MPEVETEEARLERERLARLEHIHTVAAAEHWRQVVRAVHAVDAQYRPGPLGMADSDVVDMVLNLIFAKAKDKHAAMLEAAFGPGPRGKA